MSDVEKSIVIVGSIGSNNKYALHGTGFLISINDRVYVVTCRHVVSMAESNETRFVTYNPTKTLNIANALKVNNPIFYNLETPYIDLAILEITDYTAPVLIANGINVIPIEDLDDTNSDIPINQKIIAIGYPANYISRQVQKNNPNEFMKPVIVNAVVANVTIAETSFFPNNEKDASYISGSVKIAYTDFTSIEGMSGSPVYDANTQKLYGVLMGGRNNITPALVAGVRSVILFTPVSFLINLLNRVF